jgi:hypothetical protein
MRPAVAIVRLSNANPTDAPRGSTRMKSWTSKINGARIMAKQSLQTAQPSREIAVIEPCGEVYPPERANDLINALYERFMHFRFTSESGKIFARCANGDPVPDTWSWRINAFIDGFNASEKRSITNR